MERAIRLKTRFYRALPVDDLGHEEEIFELKVEKTALAGMHCWNIGCMRNTAFPDTWRWWRGWSWRFSGPQQREVFPCSQTAR